MPCIMDLPAELKGLILEALADIDVVDSLALVWRETWHDIRTWRFQYVDFGTYNARSIYLPKLLDIIKTAPDVARYIKQIDVGGTGDWEPEGPYYDTEEDGICQNLASLINLARRADTIWLCGLFPPTTRDCPEYAVLQAAFQTSSIKYLNLHEYTFTTPAKLLEFIGCFPRVESVEIIPVRTLNEDCLDEHLWVQAWPQYAHITSLDLAYESTAEVRFFQLIADEPIFPNIQSFSVGNHEPSFIPILRRLLMRWSATLTSLELPFLQPEHVPPGETPLQLPPRLTTFNIGVQLMEGQQSCLDFITNTLLRNQVIERLLITVRYSHQCAYLMTSAETDAIARLDTAIVERVEYLVWEAMLARPCTCNSGNASTCIFQDVCRTADEWMFKKALPKVTKKFFTGMPFPEPGDFHRGPFATREHWSYDSDSGSDDEDAEVGLII
ncbi:hypothetical protein CYLTODRAFT_491160 [Cylindrobasidium torrendii FP15055 ss-10]|uniref:F-box domain-containing protein n=1 Tax=Cylindrobasidium torrendii FP15055 ss-10 TaxID=1314674 RepID=A0A0D7B8L5_9AGAR|nr:hypothetical protein CYLTODRAFT_491160 [Cylindrobasidium torrendii FP15055 ss-10]